MDSRHRDGLLAVVALAGTLVVGMSAVGVDPFVAPFPAALGVGGALLLEGIFLRYPERTHECWERPGVAVGSLLVVLVIGLGAVETGATWVVGVLAWGLLTYLVLLGSVLAGFGNPLAVVSGRETRE